MSDGSVTIDVSLEMSKAMKDLEKLKTTVNKVASSTSKGLDTLGKRF